MNKSMMKILNNEKLSVNQKVERFMQRAVRKAAIIALKGGKLHQFRQLALGRVAFRKKGAPEGQTRNFRTGVRRRPQSPVLGALGGRNI